MHSKASNHRSNVKAVNCASWASPFVKNDVSDYKLRSLHRAMKEAHSKVLADDYSAVIFSHSSGFPIYRMFNAISSTLESKLPPIDIFPFSNHNYDAPSKASIMANFVEIKKNTFRYAAIGIRELSRASVNPTAPILLIDEVLSGSCVVGIRNSLKAELELLNMKNEIKIIGIASQKHLVFKEGYSESVVNLAASGLAFINPEIQNKSLPSASDDFQLTPGGLLSLIDKGLATFKSLGFRRLINKDIAYAIPVIDLFTTDNPNYNPPLFLNTQVMRLETRPQSFKSELMHKTSILSYGISLLEKEQLK